MATKSAKTLKISKVTKISKRLKKSKKISSTPSENSFRLVEKTIKWEDAYPCEQETYKVGDTKVEVRKFFSLDDPELEDFLFKVIRKGSLPSFIKSNFDKLKKLIEKEIAQRDKLYENLSKEQVYAFQEYFKDQMYFERNCSDEYFSHEIEKVYYNYLRSYLDTGLYSSKVRSLNKKRKTTLKSHGILNG